MFFRISYILFDCFDILSLDALNIVYLLGYLVLVYNIDFLETSIYLELSARDFVTQYLVDDSNSWILFDVGFICYSIWVDVAKYYLFVLSIILDIIYNFFVILASIKNILLLHLMKIIYCESNFIIN